jgi:hypothetical protein
MYALDKQHVIGVLLTTATVLFLMSGAPGMPGGRFRLWARRGAITLYCIALAGVFAYVVLWAVGFVS